MSDQEAYLSSLGNSISFEQVQFMQLIMDNIPQFIFWKDRNSVYRGCNRNFAVSAGLDEPSEIVGKTDFDLPWSESDTAFYRQIDKRVMDSGVPEINFEEPQTIQEDDTRWLRTSKVPLRNASGEVIGILGMYEDITKRKEVELELRRLNQELERANVDLERFAFAASHDLQEPLRMIGGFVSLLENRYHRLLDQQGQQFMNQVTIGVKRMSKLIKGIMTYSRLGYEEMVKEPVLASDLVSDAVGELMDLIEDSGVQLDIEVAANPIKCFPHQIHSLIFNLVNNAIKFNDTTSPRIYIQAEQKDAHWLLQIADNGIGVEAEFGQNIYKPFKRLQHHKDFPGSGIGLSICKRVVNLHDGEIWHESNQWGGTTFWVRIPIEAQ
ncbi:MAG: ATP-binding protein [Bacteroidota bacterium]